jgi:hypothetical protein
MRIVVPMLAAVGLAAASATWAGHPLSTDDAATVTPDHLELELVLDALEASENEQGYGVGLTYGLTDTLDIAVATGYAVLHRHPRVRGMRDPELGLKWRFLDGAERRLSLAVSGGLTFPCDSDLSSGERDWEALLIASIPARAGVFHLNLGPTWVGEAGVGQVTVWGLALEMPKPNGTAWYAEIVGDSSGEGCEDDPLEALVGWSKESRSGAVYSLGLAVGLSDASPDWRVSAGFTREF